jgi:hypothetical protein
LLLRAISRKVRRRVRGDEVDMARAGLCGHKNIQHTVRYTELSPERFKSFWED